MKRQWMVLFFCLIGLGLAGCASSSPGSSDDEAADAFDEGASGADEFGGSSDSGDDFGSFDDEFGDGGDEVETAGDDFSSEFEDSGNNDEFGGGDDFASDDFEGEDFVEDGGGDFEEFEGDGEEFGGDDFAEGDFGEDEFGEFDDFGDEGSLEAANSEPPPEPPAPEPPAGGGFDAALTPPIDENFGDLAPAGPAQSNLPQITNIEFMGMDGGKVIISSDQPLQYTSRTNSELGQFIIDIENVVLPASLQRPFNTRDFEGSVGAINAYQDPGSSTARVILQMRGNDMPTVQSLGTQLVITPPGMLMAQGTEAGDTFQQPVVDPTQALKGISLEEYLAGNTRFYGKPISIEVKDADIRDVFSFIAEESGANLVLSDRVNGNVTIKLRKVPWDQALVVVMRTKRLGYVRQGNVIRIAPLESLRSETDEAKKIQETRKQIENLQVKVIPVSYANVVDLSKQVESFLSPRGKVVGDNRTSSLVVTDVGESIEAVTQLVRNLDVAPPQVLIEGKIIEARERFTKDLGINWSLGGEAIGGDGNGISITPDLSINPLGGQPPGGGMIFNVDIGTIDVLGDIDSLFAIAETESIVKVISSPRILTLHNEPAEITQTSEIPLVNSTNDGGVVTTSVTFKPVRLSLNVTPQITAAQSVIMGVEVVREFLGASLDVGNQNTPINSRTAKTKVLVQDGQTAVIGGIYQSDVTNSRRGVPGMMDLPFIGGLFRSRGETKDKTELLIFLTPRVASRTTQPATF